MTSKRAKVTKRQGIAAGIAIFAIAFLEDGRPNEAQRIATRALELARAANQTELAARIAARFEIDE